MDLKLNKKTLKILMIGDVVGEPGMRMCQKWLPLLKQQHSADALIINAENAAKCGRGLTAEICERLLTLGADVITTGNHVWKFDKFLPYLSESDKVVRPKNYPDNNPGKGFTIFEAAGKKIAVLNLMGRVFFKENLNCPFSIAKDIIKEIRKETPLIFIDFHAEATSEKQALAHFLDGQVTAIVGTHTHVPTADERILQSGTAFTCDLGFVGPENSCIGVKKDAVIKHYLTQMQARFSVETEPPFVLCGVLVEADPESGKALKISRVFQRDTF